MRVLVTGGAGYIGSQASRELLKAGHKVFVYDNLSTGFSASLPKGVEFILGDVRDTTMLSRVLKDKSIEAVIHFAAKLIVPESIEKPLDYYENNTLGLLSVARACQLRKVDKVVFSSTAAVYGEVKSDLLVDETHSTEPMNPYGRSKLMAETILRDCKDIRHISLRYFNVAGADIEGDNGPRGKEISSLVKVLAETAAGKRTSASVFGNDYPTPDGTCIRDYIHVRDLAYIHVLALKHLEDGGSSDVFNCGYGQGYSVKQMIDVMKSVSGLNFDVVLQARRDGDPACVVADPGKLKKILGWSPQFADIEVICRSSYQWEAKVP